MGPSPSLWNYWLPIDSGRGLVCILVDSGKGVSSQCPDRFWEDVVNIFSCITTGKPIMLTCDNSKLMIT